jgi:hypothetical protein
MRKKRDREREGEKRTKRPRNQPLRTTVNRKRERVKEAKQAHARRGGFDRETDVIGKEAVQ